MIIRYGAGSEFRTATVRTSWNDPPIRLSEEIRIPQSGGIGAMLLFLGAMLYSYVYTETIGAGSLE